MKRKRNRLGIMLSTIMILSMLLSICSCIYQIEHISGQTSEESSRVITAMVSNSVQSRFLRPITVSETICQTSIIKKDLQLFDDSEEAEKLREEEIATYLRSIYDGFGYHMVFAVSDQKKAYYTYKGITKYVDPENNPHDIWYSAFVESGKHYDLDVDTEEANNWDLSMFVNTTVTDDNGSFLGVCGVGVEMVELQELLKDYEQQYNIKVNLIDSDGLIQIDTDAALIENAYLDHSYLSKVRGHEYYYENFGTTSRVTTYMPDLDWYLVVTDFSPNKMDVMEIIAPSIVIFLVGILLMVASTLVTSRHEKKLTRMS